MHAAEAIADGTPIALLSVVVLSTPRTSALRELLLSPVLHRYVLGAVLIAGGLLFSVLVFEMQDIKVLSRLVEASPSPATFGGIVRPVSETTVSVNSPVRIQEVLVQPGDVVTAGTPLFAVDDGEARLTLPAARLEVEDAAVQVRLLEQRLGPLDHELKDLSSRYTMAGTQLDNAERNVTTMPRYQWQDSVERAKANFDLATLKLQRLERLHAEGVVARQEVDDAQIAVRIAENDLTLAQSADVALSDVKSAEASRVELRTRLARAEEQRDRMERSGELARGRIRYERALVNVKNLEDRLASSRIQASAGGTISEIRVSQGDLVPAGAVLARMANVNRLVVEVQIPSDQVPRLHKGTRSSISISAAHEIRREGAVRSIDPTPGPNGTHRVVIEFSTPVGVILSGQAAEVSLSS